MSDLMLIPCEDGVFREYRDEYDIVIHFATAEERDEAVKKLLELTTWIPVTDRLPEYGEEVLTQDEFGDYSLNRIVDDETGEWFFEGVIAWRTLPEPFKEVGHR